MYLKVISEEPSTAKEVSMTNIDRVCQLIHELKEQDLNQHKRRIEERVSFLIRLGVFLKIFYFLKSLK